MADSATDPGLDNPMPGAIENSGHLHATIISDVTAMEEDPDTSKKIEIPADHQELSANSATGTKLEVSETAICERSIKENLETSENDLETLHDK